MSDASRSVVVEVPSETAMTAVVRGALRSLAESAPDVKLSPRELDEIAVVLQEACTNVIRHAHRHDESIRFRVEFRRLEGALEIIVADHGGPFSLPEAPPEPERLREGGYGIHIMRSWMDEVSVTHTGAGNALRLVRRYRAAPADQEAPVAARG